MIHLLGGGGGGGGGGEGAGITIFIWLLDSLFPQNYNKYVNLVLYLKKKGTFRLNLSLFKI